MREKFNLLLKIAGAFLLIAFLSLLTKHPAVAEMGSVDKGDSSSELNIVKKKTLQNNTAMKPNIILIFMDNFGYGELGCYGGGITRGAPTPRIDKLASEGMRLTNFNVEAQCTPSRAAIMTGRYAIRTGNPTIPMFTRVYGLVQWEYTMAEMLSDAGYATGIFGKWHLGRTEGRFPTDQGFDEWYGIANTSDVSYWPDSDQFDPDAHPDVQYEYIMEGRKGSPPEQVKVYNLEQRRLIDRELTDRTIAFMKRQAGNGKPFFAFIPYTQTHYPVLPHPDFKGKTGNGYWGDILAQIDAYTGELLDTIEKLGIKDNTIVIFTSDNGPEEAPFSQGSAGPWRGTLFTSLEGSLLVPFIIRWPNKVPSGMVSNAIVHEMDLFPTIAGIVGGRVPDDRIIDGVDQREFFMGNQMKSNRESVFVYVGEELHGIKWRNWKLMFKEMDHMRGPSLDRMAMYNLLLDPREKCPMQNAMEDSWIEFPVGQALYDHFLSMGKEPPIKPGTPDPYVPPKNKNGR